MVAGRGASFGVPEVKRSLVAGAGAAVRLPRYLPRPLAMELLLTGEPVGADRAFEMGLVNRVVPDDEVLPVAVELAATIAANGPLALAATKQIAAMSLDTPEAQAWDRQASILAPVFASEDAREGARAFAEKRAPVWRGK